MSTDPIVATRAERREDSALDEGLRVGSGRDTARVMAWIGIAVSVFAMLSVDLSAPSGVRLVAVLAFCALGPGAAVICQVRIRDTLSAWALADVLSLALWAIATAMMAWLRMWSSQTLLNILGVASVLACGVALIRLSRRGNHSG